MVGGGFTAVNRVHLVRTKCLVSMALRAWKVPWLHVFLSQTLAAAKQMLPASSTETDQTVEMSMIPLPRPSSFAFPTNNAWLTQHVMRSLIRCGSTSSTGPCLASWLPTLQLVCLLLVQQAPVAPHFVPTRQLKLHTLCTCFTLLCDCGSASTLAEWLTPGKNCTACKFSDCTPAQQIPNAPVPWVKNGEHTFLQRPTQDHAFDADTVILSQLELSAIAAGYNVPAHS